MIKLANGMYRIVDRPPTEEELAASHANLTEEQKAHVAMIIEEYEKFKKQNKNQKKLRKAE
jgi:hypothetical protein